ncbi:MAG: pyridoxamine 5'-phosphate oxidase family protein [Planctomycetes bacterium]|nr:pyridoxamine 5'-phosphate oxidase family protein [Planctomycetota bacterium]
MGKVLERIDEPLCAWLAAQHMFFVATAPSGDAGHVNCSPKGKDSFRVLGPDAVAYLDLLGSGIETVAHVQQNGRIVLMFCAFDGPPRIVRLHGRGEVLRPGTPDFVAVAAAFDCVLPVVRAIVRVQVARVSDSCGFGVPLYRFVGEREELTNWAAKKDAAAVATYLRDKNVRSIDGLPGLDGA